MYEIKEIEVKSCIETPQILLLWQIVLKILQFLARFGVQVG